MSMSKNRFDRAMPRRKFLAAGGTLAAASCFQSLESVAFPDAARFEASHDAMGTLFTIVAYGPDRESL